MSQAIIDEARLADLIARIRELAPRLERQYVRSALSRAGTVIARAARRHLQGRPWSRSAVDPSVVGLRRSIQARPSSQWPSGPQLAYRGLIGIAVGARWPAGAHAHLVEFGHALWVRRRGGGVQRVGTVRGHPFLGPAVRETRAEVRRIVADAVRDGIMRAVRTGNVRALRALGLG